MVARILVPEDYGVVAIALGIYAFFNAIKDFGITSVIIINNDGYDYTKIHFSFQFFISIASYCLILISTDWLAFYFSQPELTAIMPIVGLGLFISSIEDALLTRHYKNNEYKTIFYRQLIPSLVSGVVAFTMAMLGFGVYALVFSTLLGSLASTTFLVIYNKWVPTFEFDFIKFKNLFYLGKHVITQKLSGFVALHLDPLIVAKNLGAQEAGIYKMSMDLSMLIPNTLLFQYQQVLFTEASARQDDTPYLTHRYNQFIQLGFIFNAVYFVVVYFGAPLLVPFILGDKWSGIIEPIQLITITILSSNLVNPNGQFSQILGFNYIYTYFSIVRSSITALVVLITSFYSLHVVLLGWVGVGIIANFVNFNIFKYYQKSISVTKSIYLMFGVIGILYLFTLVNWVTSGIV